MQMCFINCRGQQTVVINTIHDSNSLRLPVCCLLRVALPALITLPNSFTSSEMGTRC